MRRQHRRERGRMVIGGAMSAMLAIAIVGMAPVAFAQEEDGMEGEDPSESVESAFRLGHVTIACEEVDAQAEPLEVGVPQERTYRIINQGEMSYIRLASHTLLDELDHVNDHAVAESMAGGDEDESLWRLAEDGYWYRSVPLEVGEAITVRVSVEIPFEEDWTVSLNTGQAMEVVEALDIQALQARNKVIDLESASPWGADGSEPRFGFETDLSEAERSDL